MELSNCKELLSNNPVLPAGKMVIKKQLLKSILKLFYEMQLDLAVSCYHGSFVVLCQRRVLERFLCIAYINATCGICRNKFFWGTLTVFWLHSLIMGTYYGKLLYQIMEFS